MKHVINLIIFTSFVEYISAGISLNVPTCRALNEAIFIAFVHVGISKRGFVSKLCQVLLHDVWKALNLPLKGSVSVQKGFTYDVKLSTTKHQRQEPAVSVMEY